jgi:phage baseplate assembly protein W
VKPLYAIITPLRRGPADFVAAAGAELFASKLRHVLLTEPGELPWRTAFGAGLSRLRHQNNDAVLGEIARASVRRALSTWMPSAELRDVRTSSVEGALGVQVSAADRATRSATTTEVRP